MTVTVKHVMCDTKVGPRPFTDSFVDYAGRRFYSRYVGHVSEDYVEADFKRSGELSLTRRS